MRLMRWSAWRFSAQLAWQDHWMRWNLCGALLLFLALSVFSLKWLIPQGFRTGVLILHYTVYFGIDEIRPWPWVFELPLSMFAVLAGNWAIAYGIFRTHALAARILMGLTSFLLLLWGLNLFLLLALNL